MLGHQSIDPSTVDDEVKALRINMDEWPASAATLRAQAKRLRENADRADEAADLHVQMADANQQAADELERLAAHVRKVRKATLGEDDTTLPAHLLAPVPGADGPLTAP